ncbi:MBL fold metallo-hydrolase [Stutzerimonas kunmingensis]|uniref:MBL fold metallo-hydrolase n=1 Tax=Stutzerimonas kunmingensis TaxID=1211807 RepID=UPI002FC67FB6
MVFPRITHHGSTTGVTGSCHELHADAANSYLIDCGLFQGGDTGNEGKAGQGSLGIEFPIDTIRALIVTHVHIDHVGRIPYLLAAGFEGPILCSVPSAELLPIVLEDAFKLGVSRDQKQVERYIKLIGQRIIALPYNTWFNLREVSDLVCRIRLQRAGHILGSAYVELDLVYPKTGENKRVVFSGDLGAPNAPMLPAPKAPYRADVLVIESTYGDRQHEDRRTRRQRLGDVIERALRDNGTVLVPAFSIGRTQELLYELEDIIHRAQTKSPTSSRNRAGFSGPDGAQATTGMETNWPELPIILDSPLATRFTAAYRELRPFWNEEALKRVQSGRRPLGFEQLITVDSHGDHMRMVRHLAHTGRPAIVIAGNGMCSSGRIVNYLKAMLGDSRHNVLFVGYQASGTTGQIIQTFGPKGGYVDLDGERLAIRAGVATIGGYSAHADQEGLVKFVTSMRRRPSHISIVHGESKAKQALAARLSAIYQDKQQPLQLEIPQ